MSLSHEAVASNPYSEHRVVMSLHLAQAFCPSPSGWASSFLVLLDRSPGYELKAKG